MTFDQTLLEDRLAQCAFMLDDMVSFVILWGAINVWFGNWLAAGVALLFGGAVLRAKRFDTGLLRPSTGVYIPRVDSRGTDVVAAAKREQ